MADQKRIATQVRIPRLEHEMLRDIAHANKISLNSLIVSGIKKILEDQKKLLHTP